MPPPSSSAPPRRTRSRAAEPPCRPARRRPSVAPREDEGVGRDRCDRSVLACELEPEGDDVENPGLAAFLADDARDPAGDRVRLADHERPAQLDARLAEHRAVISGRPYESEELVDREPYACQGAVVDLHRARLALAGGSATDGVLHEVVAVRLDRVVVAPQPDCDGGVVLLQRGQ